MHVADRIKVAYRILNIAQRIEDINLIKQAKKVVEVAAKSEDIFTSELVIFNNLKDRIKRQVTRGRKPNY